MKKVLVVLSGGQDSTTCLALVKQDPNVGEIHAITFDYDQRHSREIQAARDVAKIVGVSSHEVITLGPILKGVSPLTNKAEALEQYQDFASMDAIIGSRVEKTFVPMRNALFLTVAANRAVVLGCTEIITGVCQADNANYPDCRQSFIRHQEGTINEALGNKFTGVNNGYLDVRAPLMDFSKAESIRLLAAEVPHGLALLAYTHTAYDGQYPPVGKDHATVLRAEGFREAGVPDPLVLRAVFANLMPLPASSNYSDAGANRRILDEIVMLAGKL